MIRQKKTAKKKKAHGAHLANEGKHEIIIRMGTSELLHAHEEANEKWRKKEKKNGTLQFPLITASKKAYR